MYRIKVWDADKLIIFPTRTFESFSEIEDYMDEKYPKYSYTSDFAGYRGF